VDALNDWNCRLTLVEARGNGSWKKIALGLIVVDCSCGGAFEVVSVKPSPMSLFGTTMRRRPGGQARAAAGGASCRVYLCVCVCVCVCVRARVCKDVCVGV
jgi:hypothetical protein